MQINIPQTTSVIPNESAKLTSKRHIKSLRHDLKLSRLSGQKSLAEQTKSQRLAFANYIGYLSRLSKGADSSQIHNIETLKASNLLSTIRQLMPDRCSKSYQLRELYDLLILLNDSTSFGKWNLCSNKNEVTLYTRYELIFPAIRFVISGEDYNFCGFHYNVKISI